jgi:peptidylprolyl isomerase
VKWLALAGAILSAAAFAACGGDSATGVAESVESSTTESVLSRPKPKPAIPDVPPPKKLVFKDLKRGAGVAAKAGDELTIEYVGYDYRTGKEFDAQTHHWGYDEPAVFELGVGEAVPGWDPGLQGMRVGGLRELTIPPDLAYGDGISPPGVRPSDTVIFVVELLGIG